MKKFTSAAIVAIACTAGASTFAQQQENDFYRWFIDWTAKQDGTSRVEQIVDTVYGEDVLYRTALLDIDDQDPAEILVQFNTECNRVVYLSGTEIEGISCAHAILQETSPNFWEPIFETGAIHSWFAIGPNNTPSGLVADGVIWAWTGDRMEPINTVDLQFAPPESFSTLPNIFASARGRDLQVASIMTGSVQGWLAIENDQSDEEIINWRYANARGEILASGETRGDDFGIAVAAVDTGAIDIITQPAAGLEVTRVSVGLTRSEWLRVLTRPALPPGWVHADFETATRNEGDPNRLFDDIDIVEMGSSVQPPIRFAQIPTDEGEFLVSALVGPGCGMAACPVRFGYRGEEGADPVTSLETDISQIDLCQDWTNYYVEPDRGMIRACGEEINLNPVRDLVQ